MRARDVRDVLLTRIELNSRVIRCKTLCHITKIKILIPAFIVLVTNRKSREQIIGNEFEEYAKKFDQNGAEEKGKREREAKCAGE